MRKKYRFTRIYDEDWQREKRRLDEMSKRLSVLTKKNKKISMPQYLHFRMNSPLFVYDDVLIDIFGNKKKRKLGGTEII